MAYVDCARQTLYKNDVKLKDAFGNIINVHGHPSIVFFLIESW